MSEKKQEYAVLLKPAAKRQIKKLPADIQSEVIQILKTLRGNPRPPGATNVIQAPGHYRIRVRGYRIVYIVNDKEKHVVIIKAAKRDEVYGR